VRAGAVIVMPKEDGVDGGFDSPALAVNARTEHFIGTTSKAVLIDPAGKVDSPHDCLLSMYVVSNTILANTQSPLGVTRGQSEYNVDEYGKRMAKRHAIERCGH
jgi:hypothetical protein